MDTVKSPQSIKTRLTAYKKLFPSAYTKPTIGMARI